MTFLHGPGGGDHLVGGLGCVERLFSQVTEVGFVQQPITGRYLPMFPVQEKSARTHTPCANWKRSLCGAIGDRVAIRN